MWKLAVEDIGKLMLMLRYHVIKMSAMFFFRKITELLLNGLVISGMKKKLNKLHKIIY